MVLNYREYVSLLIVWPEHSADRILLTHSTLFSISLQRLRALEDDLRTARARSDEKTAEASSVREELVREQGLSAVSQERAAVSERQLSIAQERLGEIPSETLRCDSYLYCSSALLLTLHVCLSKFSLLLCHRTSIALGLISMICNLLYAPLGTLLGTQVIDSVVASEAAQRDVALDRALAEVESLQSRLTEAEKHAEQFRLIGTSTEGMLRELRERSAASKVAQEEEVSR